MVRVTSVERNGILSATTSRSKLVAGRISPLAGWTHPLTNGVKIQYLMCVAADECIFSFAALISTGRTAK